MMEAPCKDCAERTMGCHGTCARYAEYREAFDAQKKEIKKHRDDYVYFCKLSAQFMKRRAIRALRQSRRRN